MFSVIFSNRLETYFQFARENLENQHIQVKFYTFLNRNIKETKFLNRRMCEKRTI